MNNPLTLSKKQRLVRNREFRAVLAERHRCSDHLLVVHMAMNDVGHTRIGVSVGRAQGNAVVRNRIKRLIREAFRVHQHELPCGLDILVTMSKPKRKAGRRGAMPISARSFTWGAMNESLLKLVDRCYRKTLDS